MRVIKELIIVSSVKCTLFSWNGKYLIKLEQGNLEQTYKIPELEVNNLAEIENYISTPAFSEEVIKIFDLMNKNLDVLYL